MEVGAIGFDFERAPSPQDMNLIWFSGFRGVNIQIIFVKSA